MEIVLIFVVGIIAAFWFGNFWKKAEQDGEVQFIDNVRGGMESDLTKGPFADRIEELRASEYFKYEFIKNFRNDYIVGSVAKELDLAPRVVAESVLLGRFLGRSDSEAVQSLRERVRGFRAGRPSPDEF